jgi:hypothetical protein
MSNQAPKPKVPTLERTIPSSWYKPTLSLNDLVDLFPELKLIPTQSALKAELLGEMDPKRS